MPSIVPSSAAVGPARPAAHPARLRHFVRQATVDVAPLADGEASIEAAIPLIQWLVAQDDWLPEPFARPHPERYQQYLLHCDPLERISLVAFVWGPGQATPIHDHRVWGVIGVLSGGERVETFIREPEGLRPVGDARILGPGDVDAVSDRRGDIHRVSNAHQDRVSVSIHLYGGNIGTVERATYDMGGASKSFVSTYANALLPNLWRGVEP